MNTRQPIQSSNLPPVLSVAFSSNRKRFIAALSDGLRCFRSDNCLTSYHPTLPSEGSIALAEALDDRYIAFVGGGRAPAYEESIVVFWDALLGREIHRFDFHEAVLGLRLTQRWMVVLLQERAIVFQYQELAPAQEPTPPPEDTLGGDKDDTNQDGDEVIRAPNLIHALFPTGHNSHALASLKGDLLVLPSQTLGQIQLIPLKTGSKRVLKAHQSALRHLSLSDDGALLATASEQGTLIRIYTTTTLSQTHEFRRGVDPAKIYTLAFSPSNRWLASTSDKGTLHIFDLRPPPLPDSETTATKHSRKSSRLSGPNLPDHTSSLSAGGGGGGRSSPSYQGSVQEYYGLRPIPVASASPPTGAGISAIAALKSSPWAPKMFKDVRSVASAAFSMGDDPPHWQGGAGWSWTTDPNGRKRRVRNAVLPRPGDPTGKPVKGQVAWKPDGDDEEGGVLWVVGGGSDARWEAFELLPATDGLGGWGLVYKGFRKYLTRQFVD